MIRPFLLLVCSLFLATGDLFSQTGDSAVLRRLFNEALSDTTAYHNLRILCTGIGGRLCGSPQAEKAVRWTKDVLESMGLDTVYLQELKVRHWERGEDERLVVNSRFASGLRLSACAIGGSVGTGNHGLTGKVVEVRNFDELKDLGRGVVEGKIVFFNPVPDPTHYYTFEAYGEIARYRVYGVDSAAAYGALAVVVRSATLSYDDFPHTGIIYYTDSANRIPGMAVSTIDAGKLSAMLRSDPELSLTIHLSSIEHPETLSYNVIGEIRGTEHPGEVIAFGGHLDSWDLGQGAHDDGAGVVQTIEVLRLFRKAGLRPKCTLRVVAFMDEEMAQRGAKRYAEFAREELVVGSSQFAVHSRQSAADSLHTGTADRQSGIKHRAAIEADRGGFTPFGFSIDATDEQVARVRRWKDLFLPYGIYSFEKGGSGVDIRDLKPLGVPLLALVPDSQRYFDHHHCANDTFDEVNSRELQLGSFALAAMVYLIDAYGF